TTKAGITPLMVAAGLDYWEGESPGPFTGVSEAERLEAVKLAVSLGNDVNAQADFGNYPMTGDTAYTLLYYPNNIDDLLELGGGDSHRISDKRARADEGARHRCGEGGAVGTGAADVAARRGNRRARGQPGRFERVHSSPQIPCELRHPRAFAPDGRERRHRFRSADVRDG